MYILNCIHVHVYASVFIHVLQEDIYEEVEDIYDEVAGVKAAKRSDRVTGKEEMQVRERMPLFLPGRIIHITRDTPRGGSVSHVHVHV